MNPNDTTSNNIQALLALADQYDKLGQYNLSDRIYEKLKKYYNQLPSEVRLRINDKSGHNPSESMSSTEPSRGYDAVRYGPDAYVSGKAQTCYKDESLMNMQTV